MSILRAPLTVVLVLAAAASACGAWRPAVPVEVQRRLEVPGATPIDLDLRLQPEHARAEARYANAALATLRAYADWLGPLPYRTLTIIDPAWHTIAPPAPDVVVLDRSPWWYARATMAPEVATVRGLSRRVWHDALGTSTLPASLVEGLTEFAARRIVAPLFESVNNPPGFSFLEERYFGGFVPYFFRIRLRAETDGEFLRAYRVRPRVALGVPPSSSEEAASQAAKSALVLGTLERWLGRPVLDAIIAELVRSARNGPVSLGDFERTASETSGQDLSWFFDQMVRSAEVVDYGVRQLTTAAQPDGGYLTTVTVQRYGEAVFAGRSAPRVGPFESGRGLSLRTAFADGAQAIDYWDGRDREKIVRYRTAAPALSAEIDPDRTVLLDMHRTNNSVSLTPRGSTAATRWAARYMNWVANVMLAYAALV